MDGSSDRSDYARPGRDGRGLAGTDREKQTKESPATSAEKQSPGAGVEGKKHDHSTRLLIVVAGLVIFILLWKTDLLSRILKAFGS
jgi:hypothetical protein